MTEDEATFGLTPEARYFIEQAAERAATKAVEKLTAGDCPFRCDQLADVKATLYGDGHPGIKDRVTTIEEQVSSLVWQSRLIGAASVTSIIGLIVSLATGL